MEWIDVKDKLPDEGVDVVVFGELSFMNPRMTAYPCISRRVKIPNSPNKSIRQRNWSEEGFVGMRYVTHWMPLPKSPGS